MTYREIASAVIGCVGGVGNIVANALCMTRLRITVANPVLIKRDAIDEIDAVLGTAGRGANGIEVVFGPTTVRGVYKEFSSLTGLDSIVEPIIGSRRPESNFSVHVTTGRKRLADRQDGSADDSEAPAPKTLPDDSDDLLGRLAEFLDDDEAANPFFEQDERPRLLIINGPTLNMLGVLETSIYGSVDYPTLLALCKQAAESEGFKECRCYQSNHEGDLIDTIEDAYGVFDGIIINPGGYAHSSGALLDALKAVSIPAIEVHISDTDAREDFRRDSYVSLGCMETIIGMGVEGYHLAIQHMAAYLRDKKRTAH